MKEVMDSVEREMNHINLSTNSGIETGCNISSSDSTNSAMIATSKNNNIKKKLTIDLTSIGTGCNINSDSTNSAMIATSKNNNIKKKLTIDLTSIGIGCNISSGDDSTNSAITTPKNNNTIHNTSTASNNNQIVKKLTIDLTAMESGCNVSDTIASTAVNTRNNNIMNTHNTSLAMKRKEKMVPPHLFIRIGSASLNPYYSSPPRTPLCLEGVDYDYDDDAFSDSDCDVETTKRQPMTLEEFEGHVADLHANTDYLFSEEFTVRFFLFIFIVKSCRKVVENHSLSKCF